MRITISHSRSKAEVVESIDRSFDGLFKTARLPVQLVLKDKRWEGPVLSFLLTAKMGLISTPIKGTVEVTDHEVIVDADLGLLNRLVSEQTAREVFGDRLGRLLN